MREPTIITHANFSVIVRTVPRRSISPLLNAEGNVDMDYESDIGGRTERFSELEDALACIEHAMINSGMEATDWKIDGPGEEGHIKCDFCPEKLEAARRRIKEAGSPRLN